MRALLTFFITVNAVNLPLCLLFGIMSGLIYMPILFCSFGLAAGLLAYDIYFKNQYYFYYNLGYTKQRLYLSVFVANLFIAVPLMVLILSFS